MADDMKGPSAPDPNLLRPYRGAKPPAPAWFTSAIETPYETRFVEVERARIRYQLWQDENADEGATSKPGLLLVHGNGAHAHWYDFIAPFLMQDYRVAAMTFGGMGDSGYRERYGLPTFSAEQLAVCEDAGFFAGGAKPIIAAHSFGGFVTLHTGANHSDQFGGIIIVDSPIRPPDDDWEGPPERNTPNRIYPDLTAALGRFRLAPPQPCENHYIVDYIARHSLKEVETPPGETGWTWKFDYQIWKRFEAMEAPRDMLARINCPLAYMRGEQSVLMGKAIWSYMRSLRADMAMVSIPEAEHHVMLDQPLAFIAALRTQLAAFAEQT
ncbi:MAG: alpha/beta hydrolase [Pseudomonadota bacterium]